MPKATVGDPQLQVSDRGEVPQLYEGLPTGAEQVNKTSVTFAVTTSNVDGLLIVVVHGAKLISEKVTELPAATYIDDVT